LLAPVGTFIADGAARDGQLAAALDQKTPRAHELADGSWPWLRIFLCGDEDRARRCLFLVVDILLGLEPLAKHLIEADFNLFRFILELDEPGRFAFEFAVLRMCLQGLPWLPLCPRSR
jgi:hypothetical protein